MKFTTTTLTAATLALTTASPFPQSSSPSCNLPPRDQAPKAGDVFKLIALPKPANTGIDCLPIQAKQNGFVIGSPSQNATCTADAGYPTSQHDVNYASFILNGVGELFLNTGANTGNPIQQIYVDRSGMGQGNIQYTTGLDKGIGKNQERGPFKFGVNNDLVFYDPNGKETAFQACPGAVGGGWSLWLEGAEKPAGIEGCVAINARAVKEESPAACLYEVYGDGSA